MTVANGTTTALASRDTKTAPLRLGLLSPWNQACGLATYAKFFVPHLTSHVVAVFAETDCAIEGHDEPLVKRCWKRAGAGDGADDYANLEAEIERARIDVLYINCHTNFFVQPTFSLFLRRVQSRGVKVVVHLHQLFTKRDESIALLSIADQVIVHSPENRLEALANGARSERVVVVPHGVEIRDDLAAESRESLRVKLGLSRQGPLVTSFGFIQPHKGMEAVIEAVAHLQSKGIPARGLIVGQSRTDQKSSALYLKALKDFVEAHKLEDCMSFVSEYVSDREVGEYLAASDLVVMNYHSDYYEASGACSLAVGAGAVVMASLSPSMMAFGDAVWHMTGGYPPGVSAELLIRNPQLCEQVRLNARAFARRNAWPVTAQKIQEAYSALFPLVDEQLACEQITCEKPVRPDLVETVDVSPKSQRPRVLMQNRQDTFVHRGGDSMVLEKLSEGLRGRGLDVTIDVAHTEDPASYDLVHLFNFATPELTTALAKRAQDSGVPFVVTTLYEDLPKFHHQSHAVAINLLRYVAQGQDRDWLKHHAIDPSLVVPAERFEADWLAEHAAALFTNGSGESAAIRRDFPFVERVVEVPLGHEMGTVVGPELFEREYGVKDFVLCVGRIETRKNQLMLLKALEDSDLTVVLAGGGFSYQPEYEAAVKAFKRKGRTIILNRLTLEMLSSAYSACRIHVLSSWYELPGLVSLEAAAHGKNIVVTRTGTSADYFGGHAFYCEPWDSDSISAAIQAAFYAPVKEGLVEMAKSYTWDKAVDATVSAYEGVVKGTSAQVDAPQATPVGGCYDMSVDTKQLENLIEQGEMAARDGDYDRAETILRQAEVIDATSTRVLKARGAICLAQGRIGEAISFFERALKVMPHDPNLLTGLGMCVAVTGQPVEAMPVFERVLAQSPDHLVALHQLLECSYQVGAFTRAESALRRYLSIKPQDAAIRFCLAGVLFKQGLWTAANGELSRVIADRPDHEGARELQQMIAQQLNPTPAQAQPPVQPPVQQVLQQVAQQPVAAPAASAAVEASMKDAARANERSTGLAAEYFQHRDEKASDATSFAQDKMDEAETLRREGKSSEAREVLDKVRRLPNLTDAQRDRFNCIESEFYVMDGDLELADEMYNRVLGSNPKNVRALCGKGALAAERQEWLVAQEYFDKAVALEPKYDVALAGLGLCAMVNKREEKAFELFTQAVASNPENRRALLGVLQLGYPMKKYTEIEKAINSYLELHPANIEMLYSFAGILFAQGKVEQAKNEVEKILIFEPQHTRALELRDLISGEKPVQTSVRQ